MKVEIVEFSNGLALRAVNVTTSAGRGNILAKLKALVRQLPTAVYDEICARLQDEGVRNRAIAALFGLGCGLAGGSLFGMWIARPYAPAPCMKAIVCTSFRDPDNLAFCRTNPPSFQSPADVLVRVRAVSLQHIDRRLSFGYGLTIRRLMASGGSHDAELPVVLGRSCAGTVEAIGSRRKGGLTVGDAVWLASAWHEPGLAAQFVVAPTTRLSLMPAGMTFPEAACLPYSGSVALQLMQAQRLNERSCADKRILVHGASTPVGWILIQLAIKWGALVAITCPSGSVASISQLIRSFEKPAGATLVIPVDNWDDMYKLEGMETFHHIFLTTRVPDTTAPLFEKLLTKGGVLVDTVEPALASDDYGMVGRLFLAAYIGLRKAVVWMCGGHLRWGGPELGHRTLAKLASYVDEDVINTSGPAQVFLPSDTGKALELVASGKAVGNTVITFP